MRYKIYSSSAKTWQAMYEAIQNARESVYMEMYMYADDAESYDFTALLSEKAKAGLRIRIVLDALGSRSLSGQKIQMLKENGAELYFISNYFHRTHRKILIVDEAIAFLGGVNFSKMAEKWEDLALKVRGKLVKYIVRSFAKSYLVAGGKDERILAQSKRTISGRARTWLIEHFPMRRNFTLKKIYQEHLREAKESATLITPYILPKRWLIGALHQARIRGVRVEVLLPLATDVFIMDRISSFYMYKLSQMGIKFYLKPNMNHAKAMIIDGREGIIGSQNLDLLSFEWNDEIGVYLKDTAAVRKLAAIAERWKAESVLFDPASYRPSWLDYILFPFFSLSSRFI